MTLYRLRVVLEFGWEAENAIDASEQALATIDEKLQLLITSLEVTEK